MDEFKTKGLQTKDELENEIAKDNGTKEMKYALKAMKQSNEQYLNREYIFRNFEKLHQV